MRSDAGNTEYNQAQEQNTVSEENTSLTNSDIESMTSSKYLGPDQLNKVEIETRSLEFLNTAECKREYSCLNCSMARVCTPESSGGFVEVSRTVCPMARPTCDPMTGTCVARPLDECIHPATPKCFKKYGFFPHPTDCTQFYYCNNYNPSMFKCKEPYNYDLVKKKL